MPSENSTTSHREDERIEIGELPNKHLCPNCRHNYVEEGVSDLTPDVCQQCRERIAGRPVPLPGSEADRAE